MIKMIATAAVIAAGSIALAYASSPTRLDSIVHQHFYRVLKDPYTAHTRRGTAWTRFEGKWQSCWAINARNSFGGYSGWQWFYIVVSNGRVVGQLDGDVATMACNNLGAR